MRGKSGVKGKISEIFSSVQGEGPFSGTPCCFIRFFGCNKRCSYCDTAYAVKGHFTEMTARQVKGMIKKNIPVVITGGEPALQVEFLSVLLPGIAGNGVFLETNASVSVKKILRFLNFISVHIEPPLSSGEKDFIKEISGKPFAVKIIITSGMQIGHLRKLAGFLRKFKNAQLILQPEARRGAVCRKSAKRSADFALKLYPCFPFIRVLPQMHRIMGLK